MRFDCIASVIDMFETDEIETVKRDLVEGSAGGGEITSSVRLFDFSTSCIPYKIPHLLGPMHFIS